MGDRIIEATMKQGLPAWMGMDGGLPLPPFNQKPLPSREKEKARSKLSGS